MKFFSSKGESMREVLKNNFHQKVCDLQDKITAAMREIDPELKLTEDLWKREDHAGKPGGGGRTRAFTGKIFENAGVNTSQIHGKVDPKFAAQVGGDSDELWAAGISLILHPYNPRVPTVHANFRMIECGTKVWFGGGADLTPFYPHEEDFRSFHQVWKTACAPYDCYHWMKKECDQYFVNHHRNGEMRGVSGIFFDHYNTGNIEQDFKMVTDLSSHFINSYFPIVKKRQNESFTDADVDFQLHRRGRYVEFNLLHDRGTLFGLKTKGRVESILISLPARCNFTYAYKPPVGSVHEKMMSYYFPREW
jgi:coproporphyrinogen III oxidase